MSPKIKKNEKNHLSPLSPRIFYPTGGQVVGGGGSLGEHHPAGARRLRHKTEIRKINGFDPIEVHNVARTNFEKPEA